MMKKETLMLFQTILKTRLNEITLNINVKNANIKEFHSIKLKDEGDIVSANLQAQVDSLMLQKYGVELQDIAHSLEKIKKGTYGICEMCDEEIDIERLKIKPHAKFCIKCRELHEKNKSGGKK